MKIQSNTYFWNRHNIWKVDKFWHVVIDVGDRYNQRDCLAFSRSQRCAGDLKIVVLS